MRRASNIGKLAIVIVLSVPTASTLACDRPANFESGKFTIQYCKDYYENVRLEPLPKKIGEANHFGVDVGPARWVLLLSHPPRSSWRPSEPRYYWPARSEIYITPLFDRTVSDFATAYPWLTRSLRSLELMLHEKPSQKQFYSQFRLWMRDPRRELPDEPFNNAGEGLLAHFRLLEFPWGRGFRLLTYYANGITGYGATNAELLYNFQGLTTDQHYYVSARLAVRHPALPDSIDDPKAAQEDSKEAVEAEQRRVNQFSEDTFVPSLGDLDMMVRSLQIRRDR
jgi:hypothetical protein